jgi:hypothetical protein
MVHIYHEFLQIFIRQTASGSTHNRAHLSQALLPVRTTGHAIANRSCVR